jgi:hypothetical protein
MQKVLSAELQDGMNFRAHRKEDKFYCSYTAMIVKKSKIKEVLEVRCYGTERMNYCCVWLWPAGEVKKGLIHASGSGKAGGYGYHRESAAVAYAFRSMGIELAEDIDGRGDTAITVAMTAIVRNLFGVKNVHIHKAHG